MNILVEFWQERQSELEALLEADQTAFPSDWSEFVYVDGEEGDYGVVRYLCPKTEVLVATRTIHGGDQEEVEFTEYGRKLLSQLVLEKLMKVWGKP